MKKANQATPRIAARPSAGFTLIELIVTITLVAILAAVVVPNLSDFGNNNALTSTANDLLHALQVARAEASKSQVNVVVCTSDDPTAADPTCSTSGITGWIVFLDTATSNNWQRESGETLIAQQVVDAKIHLLADNDARVSYGAAGFANPAGAKTPSTVMVLCDKRGNADMGGQSAARGINISNSGRVNVTRVTADITAMLDTGKINSKCPP